MSEEPTPSDTPLRERIAEEIRVHLARRNISAAALARLTGMKQPYISRRMQGTVAWDIDDLELIADVLDLDVLDLFPVEVEETAPVAPTSPLSPRVVKYAGRGGSLRTRINRPYSEMTERPRSKRLLQAGRSTKRPTTPRTGGGQIKAAAGADISRSTRPVWAGTGVTQ